MTEQNQKTKNKKRLIIIELLRTKNKFSLSKRVKAEHISIYPKYYAFDKRNVSIKRFGAGLSKLRLFKFKRKESPQSTLSFVYKDWRNETGI